MHTEVFTVSIRTGVSGLRGTVRAFSKGPSWLVSASWREEQDWCPFRLVA